MRLQRYIEASERIVDGIVLKGSNGELRVIPVQVEALPAETAANLVCHQREP